MTNSLIVPSTNQTMIVPSGATKDELHRLKRFACWLDVTKCAWFHPDLAAYRDYLAERRLTQASIRAHLSTIRGRYESLLRDNAFRESLYAFTPTASSVEKKALVDELVIR